MISKVFHNFSSLFFFITLFTLNSAWLLTQCGLNESYRVLHLSAHLNRVFLSIMVKSETFPTLIETQWPESYIPTMTPMLYPHRKAHANGNHTDCSLIQQARWSQVDSLSRLWVMDMGWTPENITDESTHKCNPKLLVFDLIRNGMEVLRIDCSQYITSNHSQLLDIELGPRSGRCGIEKFIFFIVAGDPHILAYDILEQKWYHKKLISKKYCTISDFLPIQPRDIAFGHLGEMLISDEDGNLYTSPNTFHNATTLSEDTIEMSLLGSLVGPTRGLLIDNQGVLFYVVSKFGAVVRCAYKQNMTAEDSEIVHMTSKNIQQIFFGSEGSVWILSDRWLNPYDQCISGF